MPSFAYDSYLDDAFKGNVTATDTYYVMLTDAAYTPNQATHTKRSDVTNEASGSGYAAGGKQVVPTFEKDTVNHRINIVFPAVTWPSSSISAGKAIFYKRRGGAASADELVAVNDFGSSLTTSNGTFTVSATTIRVNTPAAQ